MLSSSSKGDEHIVEADKIITKRSVVVPNKNRWATMLMRRFMLAFVLVTATTTRATTTTFAATASSPYRRALSSSSLAFATNSRQSSRSSFPQGTTFLTSYSKLSGASQQQKPQQLQKDKFTSSRTFFSSSSIALKMSSLSNCPTIPLRNGMEHPVIGFGTYTKCRFCVLPLHLLFRASGVVVCFGSRMSTMLAA